MFRVKLVVRVVAVLAIVGGILFGSAGRIDLPFFWAYLAIFGVFALVTLLSVSPDLLEERRKPAARGRDNLALLRILAGVGFSAQWILAGLDVGRLHWSDGVPTLLRVVGLAGFAAMLGIWGWAMRTNPFFSAAVRIQRDRGHRVVDSGPYRFVRHPGYAGFVLLGGGGPLALGSWAATLTHLVVVGLFVRRAAIEDRMLLAELPGYADDAARVRSRFLPGIW